MLIFWATFSNIRQNFIQFSGHTDSIWHLDNKTCRKCRIFSENWPFFAKSRFDLYPYIKIGFAHVEHHKFFLTLGRDLGSFTQGIRKGEVSLYWWPPVWLVWNQLYDNWQFLFLFAKQTNPNQSNRSIVQWYFFPPLVFPAL